MDWRKWSSRCTPRASQLVKSLIWLRECTATTTHQPRFQTSLSGRNTWLKSSTSANSSTHSTSVFLDATYIPLRRGTVEREAVNVAIGIRSDGGKEVLDYSIAPTENGAAWSELLQGLRARGIKDIQLFIADGLVGLQSAIEANYPQAKFQRCWVHAERNLLGYVRKNDRREIITDFKAIRQAENLQAAKERLAAFSAKWESRYKRRIKNLVQMEELFTFFSFPTAIRQTIYSTNLIESFNKSLKKMVRRKEQFPNEGALDRFIMTQVMEYNDKFENRAHRGFKDCHDTLDSMF
ncbi:transposase [Ligilactobacillus saerimneri DSM 16049]|nr:transposase [Ligilactobacillus saerimneri DSM 16049]